MNDMFYNCILITSLNLSNFNMENINNINNMFYNCLNSEYINLKNSNPGSINKKDIFFNTSQNLLVCTESEIISSLLSECNTKSCSENWRNNQKKINTENNTCVDNCSLINYKYEFLSKCLEICPDFTFDLNYRCEKCHPDCKKCNGPYTNRSSNCKSCLSSDKFLDNGNCVSFCENGYYNDYNDSSIKICKNNSYIEFSSLSSSEGYKIEDNNYNNTDGYNNNDSSNNEYNNSDNALNNKEDYTDNTYNTYIIDNFDNTENNKYNITDNIDEVNNIITYEKIINDLIPNYDPETTFEIISEGDENVVFQITTSKNQLQALYNNSLNNNNLSIIDISQCENKLKQAYNLNANDNLILLKKEKKSNKPSEKDIQFEIYEPYNKTKLNISLCEDINANIYIKAELSEEINYAFEKLKELGYDMFNINDPFYQDICTTFKSQGETDIILSDRVNYIYNNDDIKCQNNCKLSKFSEETNYLNCTCSVNEEINNMNQKFSAKKIYESFADVVKFSNYKVLKCFKLVFSKNPIPKNKGSIIILIYILIHLGCGITYIIKGISPLKNKLEIKIKESSISQEIFIVNSNEIKVNDLTLNNNVKINDNINSKRYLKMHFPPRRNSSFLKPNFTNLLNENIMINKNANDNNNKIVKTKKKNNRKRKKSKNTFIRKKPIEPFSKKNENSKINSKMPLENICPNKIIEKILPIEYNNKGEKIQIKNVAQNLDNYELNELGFNEAIISDQRTFLQIYWSILKREYPILFTFFSWDDYNLIYIKLTRFIFLIANDMALNVFFFSDDSMHKLYVNYGKYDIIQQIPQILYSTIVSRIIEVFLCFLSLTDKYIYQAKTLILNNSIERKKVNLIYRCIKVKLILFFFFTFIMFLLYWYIVTSFCAVYENTQLSFIKDCIFSFLLGIVIPFVLYLIPSALRICALKNPKKSISIYLYRLSEFIPIF